jgi:hypothetical protein
MFTLRADTGRLGAGINRFLGTLLPAEAARTVKGLAQDVARETAANLEGGSGLPRRIDTGRLQAAWQSVADGTPNSDATVDLDDKRLVQDAVVEITVPYAGYVENGTAQMAAGNHLGRALYVVRREGEAEVRRAVLDAWAAK